MARNRCMAAEIPNEFGPGPMEDSVLRFVREHRSCAVWEGEDPGVLTCRGRNDEFRKRRPMVDDRILDIVKRVGLEGLQRTPSREIDNNLITAFVERWRPETHTFHLPHGEMTITLQDVEVLLGLPIDGEAIVGTTELVWATECRDMLGIVTNNVMLKGQRIQINRLLRKVDEGLPNDAAEDVVHQTVWVVNTKNSPSEICLVRYRQLLDSMHPNQVVWQPYESELGHLPTFCVAGRDVWTARVPLVCFWLVEKHTPDRVVRQFGMVQEIPPNVDTGDALHKIDLRGKTGVNWRDRHRSHIQVWNTRAQLLCHGARLEGDMSPAHPYFDWYNRVTWRFVDHTTAALLIMVASHKQMLTRYTVGSPEYKQITAVLKAVDCLHRITAQLPLENTDGAIPAAPGDTGQPSTSSTPASHSHCQHAAPHQVVSRLDPSSPPHASPAPEFPPPPHASSSLEIPPRSAHAVPDLEIPLPTAHASSHPEIPSPTPRIFSDPAHLSFTPPSFDLGFNFNVTPPVMHTQSPSYNIGHIDHVPPHSDSMSFMPTPGLHTNPMTTSLTHISSATPSPAAVVGSSVVGSQAKQPDVHVENEHVVGLQSPPQGRPKRTIKAPPCGTGGHKAGHKAGPTSHGYVPIAAKGHKESALPMKLMEVVRVWDPRSGSKTMKLRGHTDNIRALIVDSTGRFHKPLRNMFVNINGILRKLYLTDLATRESFLLCTGEHPILQMALHDDSIWAATSDSSVHRWPAEGCNPQKVFQRGGSFLAGNLSFSRARVSLQGSALEFQRIKGNINSMSEHAELLSSVRDDISEYKIHSRKMNVHPDVNFEEFARSTDDFNGAELKAVCVEAGMLSLHRDATEVGV
ncbi:hypothetical protein SO802_021737 [Lithocarpus litseifolius]|uniref:Uncharacterized protein n=1 Tax=Lithocarpus litseifolius TaxID=425828 RepID=A0AAW2CFS2_9ROSI